MNKILRNMTVLSAAAIMLGSCAKTVTFEEASEVIKNNYTTEVKKANVKTVKDIKKADGLLSIIGKVGKTENELKDIDQYPLTTAGAAIYSTGYTIKLDGTALSFEQKLSAKDYLEEYEITLSDGDTVSGEAYTIINYDSKGYIVKSYTKVNVSFSITILGGISTSGAADYAETTTYSY